MADGFWYLATTYTINPGGLHTAYEQALEQMAICLAAGIKVFCPIAHTHPVSYMPELRDVRTNHDFWLDLDKPFLDVAKGLIVTKMKNWEESKGIKWEIDYMTQLGKPIYYVEFLEIPQFNEQ